ncbi:MAG TPA: type III pantothenate kinase [Firmicutes bacterium]|nr:type III pantothenate kinase [Candidatus Fermentithermobacillaceae bacterium]
MLFALDAGNTVIAVGLFRGPGLVEHWRISTDHNKTEDEYGMVFLSLLANAGVKPSEVKGAVLASVVPPLTGVLERATSKCLGLSPLVVGPGTKTGINVKYENPKEVGPDRIVNAVAAFKKYGGPVIVVDFGTATIFDAISKDGDYLGGAIAPGVFTSTDALFEKAARLPRIELTKPSAAIGRTTADSMRSGILYGFAAQTDGIVRRIMRELGGRPRVVATGMPAHLIAPESSTIDTVDPLLTLEGLYLIYQKNVSASDAAKPS